MQSFVLFGALVACVAAQQGGRQQYVFDLLRPALDGAQVVDILINAQPGVTFPNYAQIPQTSFQCPQQPGFYADVAAQCQVFHRCDINGNQTSYLCVNTTVFNQITLVCDYFFNVDCQGSQQYANFANSRLYTDLPLFDTPPADYVAPSQLLAQKQQEQLNAQGSQQIQQGQNQGSRGQAQGTRTQGVRVQTQGVQTQANRNNQQQQGGNRLAGRAGGVAVTQNQGGQQNADANEQQGVDQSAQQSSGRAFAVGGAKADSSNIGTLQITSSDQNEQQQ